MIDKFIAGRPATFATSGEKPWKALVRGALADVPAPRSNEGLRLEFVMASLTPNGQPLDTDNLCEPIFSVLTGELGWFGGRRSGLGWWDARKREARRGEETGCRMILSPVETAPEPESRDLLEGRYHGALPTSARDLNVNAWAWDLRAKSYPTMVPTKATLWLDFAQPGFNLGDIATGRVKNFVDCLYPIVGGTFGNPDDHRFDRIIVTRDPDRAVGADVRVRIEAPAFHDAPLMKRPGEMPPETPPPVRHRDGHAAEAGPAARPLSMSNPFSYGTCKWVVVEAAIRRWPLDRVRAELEATGLGRGSRIREYLADVRSEDGLMLYIEGDFIVMK